MMDATNILREATNLLFENGWVQGRYRDQEGRRCLQGAVFFASRSDLKAFSAAIDAVREAIASVSNPSGGSTVSFLRTISAWNDVPGRTFDEVIEVLDRAEKITEREAASSPSV